METANISERPSLRKTREWRNVDLKTLRGEIIPGDRPAVLKGLVEHWPIVRASAQSPQALLDYVRTRDLGTPVSVMVGRPDIKGLYFLRDDMAGLNFEVERHSLHATLARILDNIGRPDPPAIYSMATPAAESCPQIARENTLDILDRPSQPRFWLSNAVTTATHYDNMDGINCMVTGRKRFTFFPPDQLPNLYIGPLELGPAGQPISLVKVAAPDLERYPRFTQALAAAEEADVEPGDAVYIPNLWWHNVESLEPVNLSVNYWWFDAIPWEAEPFGALAHGLLAITPLPANRREVWRMMFDHYVFQTNGDPTPYLPRDRRGMLSALSPGLANYLRKHLIRSLAKRLPQSLRDQVMRVLLSAP
ncbi:MAG: cupin-like domain-containing protein [Steroidobacterales bacterium]|jgi:hypothetical protein